MNVLADTWRELVRRRLWPVALLLVGAAVAVPVLLAEEPAAPVAPVAPLAPQRQADADLTGQPIVALAGTEDRSRRRRVLGASKDPFEPAPQPAAKQSDAAAPVTPAASSPAPAGGGSAPSAGAPSPVSGPSPVSPPPVAAPPAEKKVYPLYSIKVRFGGAESGDLATSRIRRLEALPTLEEPVLIYLGALEGGKVAVFIVDHGVKAQGDGSCKPSPTTCETIHLREGETEFFDVVDEAGNVTDQYQMDLLDIESKATGSAAKARKARARTAKGGRKALRARMTGSGPLRYRYRARKGTLERLDMMTFKASITPATRSFATVFEPAR